ncbi:MAG: hypothetical protein ACOZBZ_03275 [Patescibacteria group bacterium]
MAFLIIGGNEKSRKEKIQKLYQKIKPETPETDPDTIVLQAQVNIGIEEIRNLKHWLSLKPYRTPPKIAIIDQAQNLTPEAQAALSKLLEEPPGETIIILASPNQAQVLPTVSSRCQIVSLPPIPEISLSEEELKNYRVELEKILKYSGGERIKFCERFKNREEAEEFCQTQLFLWREILLKKPSSEVCLVLREIQKTLKYLKANVNPRLALENLLLSYPKP